MSDVELSNIDNLKTMYTSLQNLETPNDICFAYGMVVRRMCDVGFDKNRMQESIALLVEKYRDAVPTATFDEERRAILSTNRFEEVLKKVKNFKIKIKWA